MSGAYVESCKSKAFAVLFLVFLGGAVTGALSLKIYQRSAHRAEAASPMPAAVNVNEPSLAVDHLQRELELDSQQVSRVQSVLDECIMKEADLLTELAMTRTDGRDRIFSILYPEQKAKFRALLAKAELEKVQLGGTE